jgi:hypothetical protein
MKKTHLFLVLILTLTLTGGCALFQKPPDTPDAKAAWIQQSLTALDNADLGVDAADIFFNGFCAAGRIDLKTCSLEPVAIQEWNNNYVAAKDAIGQYQAGTITQQAAQAIVERTMIKSLAAVMAALTPAKSMVKEKAVQTRGDLGVPAGQTKGIKK